MELGIIFLILAIIIVLTIVMIWMKPAFRKYRYLQVKKSLDKSNRKLIKDKEDLEYTEFVLDKMEWYSKKWYVNLTPTYNHRMRKWRKIVKKYNLDIDLCQYPEEKEK